MVLIYYRWIKQLLLNWTFFTESHFYSINVWCIVDPISSVSQLFSLEQTWHTPQLATTQNLLLQPWVYIIYQCWNEWFSWKIKSIQFQSKSTEHLVLLEFHECRNISLVMMLAFEKYTLPIVGSFFLQKLCGPSLCTYQLCKLGSHQSISVRQIAK